MVASCVGFTNGTHEVVIQNRINAQLIAAAPDMQEALESMTAIFEERGNNLNIPMSWRVLYQKKAAQGKAIIAKAKGEDNDQ